MVDLQHFLANMANSISGKPVGLFVLFTYRTKKNVRDGELYKSAITLHAWEFEHRNDFDYSALFTLLATVENFTFRRCSHIFQILNL